MTDRPAVASRAKLAICLPTYNRAELLARSLGELIDSVRRYRIPIYVSDNHSSDATASVVATLANDYDLLHYSRSDALLAADDNIRRSLGLPDTEYRWLFGDRYRIASDEALQLLLTSLDDGFDFIVLNSPGRVSGVPTQTYTQQDRVLEQLGWHMTMLTSLVYRDRALEKMDFDRFRGTNLIQTLAIFEYLDRAAFRLRWLSVAVIDGFDAPLPQNHWNVRALEVFVHDWFVGIMSLPPGYSLDAKRRALRAHTENTSLFSFKSLRRLRSVGAIDAAMAMRHTRELIYVFDWRRIVYLIVCVLLPVRLLWALRRRPGRSRPQP